MNTPTNPLENDHEAKEKRISVIPRPISLSSESPVVVVLTPELNDSMFADIWQFSFDILAAKFALFGVRAMARPWSTAPLLEDSSHSFIYTANLAWGYHRSVDRWDTWLRAWPKDIKLINSPSLLLWNTRKTYLQELEKSGVPIISTLFVEHIDEKTLVDAATYFSTSDLIVKPQVSACSDNTVRVRVNNTDCSSAPKSMSISAAVAELKCSGVADSPMMIQPFMTSVVEEGEVSVFVFNGTIGHAVQCNTQPDDYRVQFEHGGTTNAVKEISTEMIELVHATIAVCPEIPVYARVDMIRNTATGRLCISEFELIEPNLYLEHALDEGAAFVHAVLQASS